MNDSGRRIESHEDCFTDFSLLVRDVLATGDQPPPSQGLDRLARKIGGNLVLVHRAFPNETLPLLVYLAHQSKPVPVTEVYDWLKKNELSIKNPANQILRLKERGLAAAFEEETGRHVIITQEGRRIILEYSNSLG